MVFALLTILIFIEMELVKGQTTEEQSKGTRGAVIMVPGFWLLNHYYAFGVKCCSAGCDTYRCHLLWLFLDSGTLVQEAQAWVLSLSPAYLDTIRISKSFSSTCVHVYVFAKVFLIKPSHFCIRKYDF